MSGHKLDLRENSKIMRMTKSGPKPLDVELYLKSSSNTKDEIFVEFGDQKEPLMLQRKVWKNGSVREGIFNKDDIGYGRLLLNSSRVRIGQMMGRNLQGKGVEIFPNEEEFRGKFNKGKLQHKIPDLLV